MKNFYKILEIKESATAEEIKEAFRRLSKKTHPDNNVNNQDLFNQFQDINEANQVLSNHNRRLAYDRERKRTRIEKWQHIQKVALIFVSIAIIGFLFIDNLNNNSPQQLVTEKNKKSSINIQKDEPAKNINNRTSSEALAIVKDTIVRNEPAIKQKSEVAERDSVSIKATKSITGIITKKKINEKELSEKEMENILRAINLIRDKNNNLLRCIKIRKTNSSNIKNWLMVPTFFREKGFIISGREVVNDEVKGMQINESGECFTLTIGYFE